MLYIKKMNTLFEARHLPVPFRSGVLGYYMLFARTKTFFIRTDMGHSLSSVLHALLTKCNNRPGSQGNANMRFPAVSLKTNAVLS